MLTGAGGIEQGAQRAAPLVAYHRGCRAAWPICRPRQVDASRLYAHDAVVSYGRSPVQPVTSSNPNDLVAAGKEPPVTKYLFLGGYTERGGTGLQCFLLLLALKVLSGPVSQAQLNVKA